MGLGLFFFLERTDEEIVTHPVTKVTRLHHTPLSLGHHASPAPRSPLPLRGKEEHQLSCAIPARKQRKLEPPRTPSFALLLGARSSGYVRSLRRRASWLPTCEECRLRAVFATYPCGCTLQSKPSPSQDSSSGTSCTVVAKGVEWTATPARKGQGTKAAKEEPGLACCTESCGEPLHLLGHSESASTPAHCPKEVGSAASLGNPVPCGTRPRMWATARVDRATGTVLRPSPPLPTAETLPPSSFLNAVIRPCLTRQWRVGHELAPTILLQEEHQMSIRMVVKQNPNVLVRHARRPCSRSTLGRPESLQEEILLQLEFKWTHLQQISGNGCTGRWQRVRISQAPAVHPTARASALAARNSSWFSGLAPPTTPASSAHA